MNFPVVLLKDKDSDYGVIVPDLPGCYSAGSTIDEALAMAQEAIELHLEGLAEEGMPVPGPGTIEQHKIDPDCEGGMWAIVSIDPANLRLRAKRINITIPERVLDAIDRYARRYNETRSGLLVKAVAAFMAKEPTKPRRSPKFRTRREMAVKEQ